MFFLTEMSYDWCYLISNFFIAKCWLICLSSTNLLIILVMLGWNSFWFTWWCIDIPSILASLFSKETWILSIKCLWKLNENFNFLFFLFDHWNVCTMHFYKDSNTCLGWIEYIKGRLTHIHGCNTYMTPSVFHRFWNL